MADFGGFEIEDDVQESPSASTFGGFEIEDEEPSASSPDVQVGIEQPAVAAPQYGPGSEMEKYKQEQARIRRTADWYNRGIIGEGRKHLGTQEDGFDAFEYDAEHAPAFAPQDEEGKAIHERVKAFKGGNLGHFNRPMKIDYDEKTGKAKGYGTTRSTIVEELDGTWSVIPTIWRDKRDGATLEAVDEQDAREHYREDGGERFGNFKTKEEAIAAAKDIHELHQRAYGAKWNQWINEHWDEVDDSVKNADGVREAHEAWERAGRPGIRFTMRVDGEERGADGANGPTGGEWQQKPMGILEHGAKSLQAATGREYGEGMAALLNIVPFGRQSESFDANRHVAALERARSGEYDDKDIEEVAKNLGPGYWEEVRPIYAINKDDARKFLSGMAESELREITRNKKGAALDMEARPLSGWGKAVASTVENSGYVNSFIYGSVLIPVSGPAGSFWSAAASGGVKPGLKWIGQSALKSAAGSIPASVAGGMERASDLANKTYEIGENAELRVIDNNYSTLVSALKGGAGSVVENMVVEGLTDEAINIGLLGAAKLFLRYPGTLDALKGASRGLIRSGAGRALIRLGRGYNTLSQFTQFDSIPSEQFEEILQPIFDDVVGLGKHKGEKTDTFGEYAGKMFTSKNQADILLGLVGTMLVQGGAAGAYAASRRFSKEGRREIEDARRARSTLIEAKADPKMVNALTDEEAMSTAEAYRAMLQNPKIAEDIANAFDDRRGEIFSQLTAAQESKMNGDLADLGITPKKFTIPIKEGTNGAVPDFKEQLVVNPTTGESFQGRMVVDAESGVRIVDNGAGNQENAYTVFDPMTGKSLGVDNLYTAKRAADFLVANQQLYKARDEIKLDFINDEWTKNYGDAKVFAARTIDEAIEFSRQHGVDVTRNNGFSPTRRGWRLEDGTVVLVRDNIKTPLEARQLMRHENIGHSDALSGAQWLDAGGTIGELREQNLKRVDASNPAERLRAAKESVANIVQRRMHNPTTGEKLSHAIRNGLRKLGYNLNMNDADLEVEAAKVEKAMREGKGGSIDLAPILRTAVDVYTPEAPTSDSAEPTETIETGEPNETGNGTDEAQSQPEQGEAAEPAAGEAEESVEAESPRAEAPAAGVVEPEKRGESAATAKPVSERNIVEKLTDQAPVQELPVGEVFNDDSRIPNFKEGANPETGEVEPLTGEPYDLVSNPIVVMEFKDGKKVVVTGRHRLALYKRSGRKTIAARVIREADGWTVDDAKAIDAIGNIIDEKGTVKDYVNYFNNAKPTRAEAKAGGFLDRPKGQRAFGIFEGATEATKSVIDWNGTGGDGLISADQAGIIAEAAPKGENKRFGAVQRILVQKALAGLRGKKLGILARSLAEEAKTRKDTPNVSGEMQLDLFTSEDDQKLLTLEEKRSDYRVKKSEEYGRIAEVLRTALAKGGKLDLNADYAKELDITDPNDKKQLAAARDKAVEHANYWENAVTLDEADKAAMDAEINAKADAKAKKLAEVKAKREATKSGKPAPKAETSVPPRAEAADAEVVETPVSTSEKASPISTAKPAETAEPVKEASKTDASLTTHAKPAVWPRGWDNAGEEIKGYVAPQADDIRPRREVAIAHRSGGSINAPQKIKGVVESVDGDKVKVYYRDGMGYDQHGTFDKREIVGVMPLSQPAKKAPASAPVIDAKTDVREILDANPVKANGERDDAPYTGRMYYDAEHKFAWKIVEGVGNNPPRYHIFQPDIMRVAGNKRYTIKEYILSKDGTTMKDVDYRLYNSKEEAQSAFDRMIGLNTPASVPRAEGATTPPKSVKPVESQNSTSTAKPAAKTRQPSIKMKDAAAEKKAKAALDAINFDTPELTPAEDAAYMDAVRRGDMETAQRMVDEAAERSGYGRIGFHGTKYKHGRFTEFAKGSHVGSEIYQALSRIGVDVDSPMSKDKIKRIVEDLKANGKDILSLRVALKNPLRISDFGESWHGLEFVRKLYAEHPDLFSPVEWDRLAKNPTLAHEMIEAKGYDGLVYDNTSEGILDYSGDTPGRYDAKGEYIPNDAYIPFHASQIKSADAVTRDDAGNVIPLSQRFNPKRDDIRFDTPELDTQDFDPDRFGKLVTGVGKLVDVLMDSGYKDFKSLATYIYEQDPEKYGRAKPVLQDIWNAVARARGLNRVDDATAERIFGIIEAQAKEVEDGAGDNRTDGGIRTPAERGERSDGVLADRPGGSTNPDGRVDGQRSGGVPGLGEGVAGTEATGGGQEAGGGASERTGSVADSAEPEMGERETGRDSEGNGDQGGVSRIKKRANKAADSTKPNPSRRDFVMTKAVEDAILEKQTAQRVRNNLAAIRLIRELKARDYVATPDEQATLAKFVGWGGLREKVFGWGLERAYDMERSGDMEGAKRQLRRENIGQSAYDLHKELRSVLNDEEYESAKASASTAFYTPIYFVEALHDNLRYLGVKGGRFLGPSAGTGNFASAAGEYEKPVNWQFVEKDVMTGEMLKALFPNQRVTIGGFEDTKFPDGFFDFAIDNVPYADVPINDRTLSSKMFKIHDYFFAKTLAKLRPGGVMAFLTSTGTLDKTSPILRQFLTEHGGKIVGAVRLPNGFFSENAGTDVASDLVVVQKVEGRPDNSAFEKAEEYGETTEWVRRKGQVKKPLTYNGYFKDHPEQIVGKMEVASGQFGPTLKYSMPDVLPGDLSFEISKAIGRALGGVDKDALLKSVTVATPEERAPIYDEEGLRQGNVTMKDGKPFIKSGEMLEPISLPNDRAITKELTRRFKSTKSIMDGIISLRRAMRDVIDAQMADNDIVETDLAPLLAKLNEAYDAFVKKNGTLHDKWIAPFVLLDKADGNRMLALERVVKDESGKPKVVKSDIFTKRVISRGQRATKADTPKDALVISYSESGAINVSRIAELLGVDEDEAIAKLKESGDAFENPQTGRLEPSWEYLSGRVRAKLAAARAAVEAGEESYRANVEALEKVQPPMVRLEDAEIKFGATWVDPECMKDFLRDAFGAENMRIGLGKNEVTGQWNVELGRVMNEDPWGETSWSPQEFVSRVLNHGSMNHYDTDPIDKKRYLNEQRTEANKLAAEKLHHAFSQFIQSSDKWAEPMYERYNAVMTDMVEIKLPNNILPFRAAGMSEATLGKLFEGGDPNVPKKGREYQSAVISRGVLGGGSLCLAHCVGAGKTLEMQSIGILGRHLGMFKKPMYVVPNHMLEQFTNEFVEAFPNANILKMSEADVKPENRRAFFAQVANGDWDAIVVKHSTFSKKLAMSDEYQKEFIEAQRRDLIEAIAAMREAGEKISVDQATKKLERLEAKLEQLANAENHDSQIVPFEELGVDQLFVDEAHNFKGMPITTRQGRTGGLSQGDSQRAVDMQMKTQYVQSLHGGDRGVVFATGTPLSNAPVVEAYVMLKYLAPNKLEEQGLKHFDDFVDAFGRITTESEFSLDGKTVKEKEKVSAFVNIPELMKLLRSVVDIVNPDQLDIPRPKPKYHMIDVDMSSVQERVMEMVAREAATPPSREERNKYLTLTRIAKNACLTPRLLGFEDGGNKIIRAVSEIKKMYDETADNRGAQLVFTDIFNRAGGGTDEYIAAHIKGDQDMPYSRGGFNLNEEIRDLLVAAGIPKDEIAIIQDIDKSKGDKDANKSALFAKVRAGEVRVLIGSRPKMGEGTNVQERLAAIHLLHPGWKPSEDEQAIGRIIRFGNTYKEGQIFYYLTKGNANIGSYETKNHQLIGVKSKLIDQVMHGDDTVREIDMDESAMDRDMLMGLASGNKALMELIDVKKRVHKLELNTESTLSSARRNKDKAEANARMLERRREEFAKEQEGVKEWREKNDGKPFVLSTPDGRSIEKVKDMAEYVAGEVTKRLTKDRYDREERTVLGNFNGVELVLAYDRWGDEKFRLAVPLLGVAREINYSGFLPDFSQGAMTAFKGKIFEMVSPDFAKAQEAAFADQEKQAKKMSADADKLQKDYEQMRGELVKLRRRQSELERAVTPLVVQAVEDRKTAMYGNWFIEKPGKGQMCVAQRESDGKSLSAPTVKELIPLMDAEDFASPRNAATKTPELRNRLTPNSKGETPSVDTLSVDMVNFDTPELSPTEEEYVNRVDKTPTDKDKREIFGFTKADIDHEFDVLHMKIPKHVVVHDDQVELQADALLANREYMAKLSRAVYRFGRPISAYENVALGKFWKMRAVRVNELQKLYDELAAIPKEDLKESPELAAELKGVAADLAKAKSEMFETGVAKKAGMSEVGRSLRSNRFQHYLDNDYSYAGLLQTVADAAGGLDRVPPEMQKEVKELADRFAELDEEGREIYKAKLKAFSDRVVEQIKNGAKMRRAVERRAGDEAKRVTRNYNEALVQIEIAAKELGDTLIGMADQQYPGWGKWLKWLGEFHCYENPNITEEEVVAKIVEDVRPFVENVDENQVRDALTGYGHSYKMSRYDAQRLMNDLRAQALEKVKQREMREKGTLPLATGPQRDEPSDALRAERKKTYEMKKEIPDEARDAKHLKGLLDSAKTRVKNRIADMERAIETGERIPAKERTVAEDAELRELRKRRDELQKVYDEMFKTERGMTDAQRIAAAEKAASRELELAMEDLARAQSGDFSKRPKRAAVTSDTLETLRDRVQQVRDSILELKKAKYEFGMTPEEIAALNARKIANRERAMLRQAERIERGDALAMKKVQPPMPPEMQKRYDELARQMKKGRQKLADMRLAALNATKPAWRRLLEGYGNFFISAQRALRATLDFSAVLRQAARITLAHPVKGARAFAKAWDAAKSEASLAAVNDEITSDPTIREAVEKFGLHLRETDSENARDVELYYGMERSRVKVFGREFGITDIPWFGELMLKSERHYITYLNAVSAELYSSVVNDRTRFPAGATPWQKKMVADMVNVWNGSAALSNERRQALQRAGVNLLFWAPQLAVSRIQSAVGYSIWHPFAAEGVKNAQGKVDPVSSEERRTLAKIGAAEYVRSTAATLALGWLLRWLFSDDDDKYYFKKASVPEKLVMLATPKIGNTTIDLSGGEASVYRLVYQLFAQEKRSGKGRLMKFGEYGSPTVMGTLGRFAEGKLAPWASTAVALWTGKDYVGKEFTWTDMVTSLVVPLSFEDIKDQFVQNGLGKSLVTAPLTILGAGGSTYDRYPYENAVNRFREDKESFGPAAAQIDALAKAVAKDERDEKELAEKGLPPNTDRLQRIESRRAEVLRLIRENRK